MAIGYIRKRFRQWWQSKLPLTDTLLLTQRNVYILPTRAGWMLAITLMVLLIASINYQLNLGYLLTFMLAGAAVVGMHVCHGNLRGITMHLIAPSAQYAGATAQFDIRLSHERRAARPSIGLSLLDAKHWSWTDVQPEGSAVVQVGFTPPKRGLHRLPDLTAETRLGGRCGGPRPRCWCTPRPRCLPRPCPPASRALAAVRPRRRKTPASLTACAATGAATP
jgi:uncharacterized protein (DUF58 family)